MRRVPVFIIITGLLILPLFQNCGVEPASNQKGLYVGDGYNRNDCLSAVVDCGPKEEFLQISLDLPNPLVMPTSTNTLIAYGRCNNGNYPSHLIRYVVTGPLGGIEVEQYVDAACNRGLYQLNVGISGLANNTSYTLFVQIIGEDADGDRFQNLQANGSASIDFSKQ